MLKTKQKLVALLLILLFLPFLVFFGCDKKDDGKLKVVCTIFPQYDWVREITKDIDDIDIKLIVDNGADMHSYQPTLDDAIAIKNCDVLIYCGGESEEWVEETLRGSKTKTVVNLLEILEGKNMAIKEDGEEDEFDEHVWLSLKNTQVLVEEIKDVLIELSAENEQTITNNTNSYIQELNNLENSYEESAMIAKNSLQEGKIPTFVFGDRFPFVYLLNDYGIAHFEACSGCSTEAVADFETIQNLASKINELDLDVILVIDGSTKDIANSINNMTDKTQEILTIDSMQSVSLGDLGNKTFLKIMEDNLIVFQKALEYCLI